MMLMLLMRRQRRSRRLARGGAGGGGGRSTRSYGIDSRNSYNNQHHRGGSSAIQSTANESGGAHDAGGESPYKKSAPKGASGIAPLGGGLQLPSSGAARGGDDAALTARSNLSELTNAW